MQTLKRVELIDPIGNRTTCATARPTQEAPMISHAKISRHRRMAQGGMNPETETEKLRADSRAYLR